MKTSNQSLHFDNQIHQESHLTLRKLLIVVIFLPTYGACPFITSLPLKPFKTIEALFMKHVRTAEYLLIFLKVQVVEADGTCVFFFLFCAIEVLFLDVLPLHQSQWQIWSLNKSKLLCQ